MNSQTLTINDSIILHPVEKSNSFTGIKICDGKINVYVPQVFRYEKETFYKDILLFLKSLSLSKSPKNEKMTKGKEVKDSIWPFESYLWIIKDYIENGYYYNREKVYSTNSGKIEWKKTLKNTPIYSNGNLIYDKFVTSKMSATNDMIAQIYRLCLKQSIQKIGWLFSFNMYVDVQQIISKKEMIYRVKQELNNTFDDIKRLRFNHMLKILTETEGENIISKSYMYGIENYYYVYETMIDMFFDGIKQDKKNYNPNGYWKLDNQAAVVASSLRPDTIIKRKDITCILDAKMYKYGVTHNVDDLPETQSIQKQITYGDYIMNALGEENVRNAFIIPYDKELEKFQEDTNITYYNNRVLAYIGYAYADWREGSNNSLAHDKIYTFLIDYNYLLRNYRKVDEEMIDTLCSTILERSK
ncbi:MAG: LlaJI family restriction endonuclease [Erysipelotrichaceae bacterium]|nr:LlaJI family restriction endonuclease [Erysipelotrichaceae bacterium]